MPDDPETLKPIYRAVISQTSTPPLSPCDRWMAQVTDRTQPVPVRLEAIDSLARHCRDHRSLQTLRPIMDHAVDDLAVRSAIVRALAQWEEGFLPMMAVAHALCVRGLRSVAIETLDRMAPVTGQKETRLLKELASLQPGASKHLRILAMPGLYGRDPRYLDYLREMLSSGNRWERAMSASLLYGLGEVEVALTAANDPDARVRKSLACAVQKFGGEATAECPPGDTPVFAWQPFLQELSEFRLTDPQVTANVPAERISSKWLGEPPATETQVQDLEHRIGCALPPSYREFLASSNGFHHPSSFIPMLYGVAEVGWFHVQNADWANAYRDTCPGLGSCLQVSAVGDAAVVLLNPQVVEEGEWQACFFANWIAGVRPYPSFRAFLESELDNLCEWRGI